MTNTKALHAWIKNNDLTIAQIATTIGIAPFILLKKMGNELDFLVTEIVVFKNFFNMSLPEINTIFFNCL